MLWYEQPADDFWEALPLGNGRTGAMVYGRPGRERLSLNDDKAWSGVPGTYDIPDSYQSLNEVRALMRAGHNRRAQDLLEAKMLGTRSESYMPLGNLFVEAQKPGPVEHYHRQLDLGSGIYSDRYTRAAGAVVNTAFVSPADGVLVYHRRAEQPFSLSVRLDSLLRHRVFASGNDLCMECRCPDHVEPEYLGEVPNSVWYAENPRGLLACVAVRALTDGALEACETGTRVVGATWLTLLVATQTDYDTPQPMAAALGRLDAAAGHPAEALAARHRQAFTDAMGRCGFSLEGAAADLPTDRLLADAGAGDAACERALAALMFRFGRYLLVSASLQGLPATLCGIWNEELRPAWSGNYTTNINTEMNYWAAEPTGLPGVHLRLVAWLESLVPEASRVARELYHARGWCIFHNVDLWKHLTPVQCNAQYGFWPMAGAWLCGHVYQHYLYTGDKTYLRERALPLLAGSAEFLCDWLTVDASGRPAFMPSTSPENPYFDQNGDSTNLCCSAAMDIALAEELFGNYLAACEALGEKGALYDEVREKRRRLPEYTLLADGRLCEWDADYPEAEPGHRHFSHLYGLYPGSVYFGHPRLMQGAALAYRKRMADGSGTIGWSAVWAAALAARLHDAPAALDCLRNLWRGTTEANLLNSCASGDWRCFQIDACLGTPAAIAEMLLQNHTEVVELLPALPAEWPDGRFTSLAAPGDITLDARWQGGRVVALAVTAGPNAPKKIRLAVNGEVLSLALTGQRQVVLGG